MGAQSVSILLLCLSLVALDYNPLPDKLLELGKSRGTPILHSLAFTNNLKDTAAPFPQQFVQLSDLNLEPSQSISAGQQNNQCIDLNTSVAVSCL